MENKINMSNLQVLDLVEIRMKVDENLSFFQHLTRVNNYLKL